jgi:hypothetical protein
MDAVVVLAQEMDAEMFPSLCAAAAKEVIEFRGPVGGADEHTPTPSHFPPKQGVPSGALL